MKGFQIITILLILSMLTACANNQEPQNPDIRIGAVLILTGVGSNQGTDARNGIDLAIKEINQEGGVNKRNISVAYEDNPNDEPLTGVTALKNLKAQGIDIVIGPIWSSSGLAMAPVACEDEIVLISPGVGMSEFNEKCDSIFNLWQADKVSSTMLGKMIYDDGHRRLAILGSTQSWEAAQAEFVRQGYAQADGQVTITDLSPADSKDYRTELLKIKTTNPDALYLQYSYLDLGARQARESGIEVPIYTSLIDQTRVDSGKEALEGAVSMTSVTPTDWFKEKFEKEYGKSPEPSADTAYDTVMLIAEAMRKTGKTDVLSVKEYLKGVKSYNGASGNLQFNENRGITKPFSVVRVENGKIVTERTIGYLNY